MKNLIICIALCVLSCTQEEVTPREYPRVKTNEVTNLTNSGALFNGEIIFASVPVLDHGFIWTTIGFPTLDNSNAKKQSLGAKDGTGSFEYNLSQTFQAGKKYSMRAYAKSSQYTVYGKIVEFVVK